MSRFLKFLKMTGTMFLAGGVIAFGLYFGLNALLGHSPIVVAVPFVHVAQYSSQYPLPYLLSIAFIFAVVSAFWLTVLMPRLPKFRLFQIALIPLFVVLLTGPIWGMLWVYHDMQAGFFPDFSQMIDYLLFGARQGLFFAFNGAVFSFPLNILAYALANLLLLIFMRRLVSAPPLLKSNSGFQERGLGGEAE
jgi:hypothetical protein